jgi:hypothetical protein
VQGNTTIIILAPLSGADWKGIVDCPAGYFANSDGFCSLCSPGTFGYGCEVCVFNLFLYVYIILETQLNDICRSVQLGLLARNMDLESLMRCAPLGLSLFSYSVFFLLPQPLHILTFFFFIIF